MDENVTIGMTHELKMAKAWWDLYNAAEATAQAEATKLYRLAWRMEAHGCSKESVDKCREEARYLHNSMDANPAWFLNWFTAHKFVYAFKF